MMPTQQDKAIKTSSLPPERKTTKLSSSFWQCGQCSQQNPSEEPICIRCALSPLGYDPLVGQIIRSYQINRRIEGGLINIVYEGTERHGGRSFAIKRIPKQLAETLGGTRLLFSLIRKWKNFKHPCASSITDIFETKEGDLCWVSPWLEGKPLHLLLSSARNGLSFSKTMSIMKQLCGLLQSYHESGLIHAQLRIEQLFVQEQKNRLHLKLSDLGWGNTLKEHFHQHHNQDEGTLRALRYLAPEQLLPESVTVDHRVDVYASAAICFHILTGELPYPSPKKEELCRQHLYAPPPRLNMSNPHKKYSPQLEEVIRIAMAKQPQDRYASMRSFLEALQAVDETTAIQPKKRQPNRSKKKRESISLSLQHLSLEKAPQTSSYPHKEKTSLYLGEKKGRSLKILFFLCLVVAGILLWCAL